MRALFVWETPPEPPATPPQGGVMRMFDRVAEQLYPYPEALMLMTPDEERAAERKVFDAVLAELDALKPPPPPPAPQPALKVAGSHAGLTWAWMEVPPERHHVRVPLNSAPPLPWDQPAARVDVFHDVATFLRHRFVGEDEREEYDDVFVREGVDLDRVGDVLPEMLWTGVQEWTTTTLDKLVAHLDALLLADKGDAVRRMLTRLDPKTMPLPAISAVMMVTKSARWMLGKERTDFLARAWTALAGMQPALPPGQIDAIFARHA